MFSHPVQACGTTSTSQCLYALSPPSEEFPLIASPRIPSCSPALGGSGRIWENPRNRDLGPARSRARLGPRSVGEGAGSGKCGENKTGSGAGAGVEVRGVGWYTWRLEGIKASKQ